MARFILLLLFVLAGALVVALVWDHRSKLLARVARLRSAFLHGAPLGGYTAPAEMREVQAGGWLRFRVPGRWREERGTGEVLVFQTGGPASPILRVQVTLLAGPQPVDSGGVHGVLRNLRPGRECVVHELPGGPILMKCAEAVRDAGQDHVSYEWHLAQALGPGRVRLAQFHLSVPVTSADELIVQSDVSLLDREVRAAVFDAAG